MISYKLHQYFNILETAIFPTWKKANKKERDWIAKKLGELKGKMIIDEIKKKSKKIKLCQN